MESPIPSSAFIKIGQRLALDNSNVIKKPTKSPVPIKEPALLICHDITSYDIIKGWAHKFIEYYGEYANPFM